MEAGDDRGARGRADGSDGPSVGIAEGARRELIEIGRGRGGVAVAAHLRTVILVGDPEDVGLSGEGGEGGERTRGRGGDESGGGVWVTE